MFKVIAHYDGYTAESYYFNYDFALEAVNNLNKEAKSLRAKDCIDSFYIELVKEQAGGLNHEYIISSI